MKKQIFFFLKLLGFLLIMYLLYRMIDWPEAFMLLGQLAWPWFLVVLAISVWDKIFMGLKWQILLRLFMIRVPLRAPVVAYLRSKVFPLVTPSSIGVDVYKVWYLRQYQAPLMPLVSSIFVERLAGALSSLAIISLMFYFAARNFGLNRPEIWGLAGLAAFAGITVAVFWLVRKAHIVAQLPGSRRLPVKIRTLLVDFSSAMARTGDDPDGKLAWYYLLSILEKTSYGAAVYFSALAVGVDTLSFLFVIAAAPLLALLERLPISISTIGMREGLFVVLLQPFLHDTATAMAAALTMRLADIATVLICLGFWIGSPSQRASRSALVSVEKEIRDQSRASSE